MVSDDPDSFADEMQRAILDYSKLKSNHEKLKI